jgi:hypothetical protein
VELTPLRRTCHRRVGVATAGRQPIGWPRWANANLRSPSGGCRITASGAGQIAEEAATPIGALYPLNRFGAVVAPASFPRGRRAGDGRGSSGGPTLFRARRPTAIGAGHGRGPLRHSSKPCDPPVPARGARADWPRGECIRCPPTSTARVRPGFPAMPGGTSGPPTWTSAGCRAASAAGASTPASAACASPTGPTGSIWTGSTWPAPRAPHPEHGSAVLAAATAVPTGSPGPRDGGGRSETVG